ncbi:MAG: hypothetical protein LBF88_08090, partial [Planctomycetaceae bacterium]|nr:hypothetical protein [Planctomycetaceae bacterium]
MCPSDPNIGQVVDTYPARGTYGFCFGDFYPTLNTAAKVKNACGGTTKPAETYHGASLWGVWGALGTISGSETHVFPDTIIGESLIIHFFTTTFYEKSFVPNVP